MFSVVVPLFNKEFSIESTLKSVLAQTFEDFELIVVDDGSTDGSLSVVERVTDRRCRVIRAPNGGVSSARNIGMRAAKFEYIAFLDADDLWRAWHLEVMLRLIGKFGASTNVFAGTIVTSNSATRYVDCCTDMLIENYFEYAVKPIRLLSSSSFVVKRSVLDTVGFFDENLAYGEDVEYWYRLFKVQEKLAITSEITAEYRLTSENRASAKLIPLHKRFHSFDFENASSLERQYLGKLALLLVSDYVRKRQFAVAWSVLRRYWRWASPIARYGWSLLLKRLGLVTARLIP